MNDVNLDEVCAVAAAKGAIVVVFPEMFSNGYSRFDSECAVSRKAWIDGAASLDDSEISTATGL
jgi:predicted amidohydrolase